MLCGIARGKSPETNEKKKRFYSAERGVGLELVLWLPVDARDMNDFVLLEGIGPKLLSGAPSGRVCRFVVFGFTIDRTSLLRP